MHDFHVTLEKAEVMLGKLGPAAVRYIYEPMKEAAIDELVKANELSKQIEEIFSVYSDKEKFDLKHKVVTKLGTSNVTRENLIMIALNCGTDINRKRLMDGHNISGYEINQALAYLDERDWTLVKKVWDLYEQRCPELARVEAEASGAVLKKQEAVGLMFLVKMVRFTCCRVVTSQLSSTLVRMWL